ncbi:4-hydroxybenzoate octaprenyltransferase [Hyphomonas sp.]|uniref:4-hydroxybenzoate octaprenyltransferase n=1 Tax=Hyphomonas sp. TaxID=87 RepID=UPI003529D159
MTAPQISPADSALPGWLSSLPEGLRPYAMLARWDRPVGIWLLYLPCLIGLAFERIETGLYLTDFLWAILFLIGATAMRGAGCTWNDITDRDFDAQVERTALRPLPAGLVTLREAHIFLGAQLAVGFLVWLCLPGDAKIVALLSIPLVAAYPFMKRVTWWPQAWLGATFNWGALVGVAVAGTVGFPAILLYVGLACWTVAYDTIYALQDREDDALIGVKSTARLFGKHAALYSFGFFIIAAALIAAASGIQGAGRMGAVTSLAFLGHATAQISRLKRRGEGVALAVFKSNVWTGALVALGLTLAAMTPEPAPRTIFSGPEIVPDGSPDKVTLPFGLELKTGAREPGLPETWLASEIRRTLERDGYVFPDTPESPDEP